MNPVEPKKSENLLAKRKRLSNMRIIIVAAGAYIIYDGIRLIRTQETTPPFFYVFLVLFTGFMIFAFWLNFKRIQAADKEIAEEQAKEAQEAREAAGSEDDEEEAQEDWPDDLSQN